MNDASHKREVASVCVAAVLLSGCVLPSPSDLHVTSIEIVKPADSPNRHMIDPSPIPQERRMLKIRFTSATDINASASRSDLVTSVDSFFCDRKKVGMERSHDNSLGSSRLFDEGTDFIIDDKQSKSSTKSIMHRYYILMRVSEFLVPYPHVQSVYGMSEFRDVCFHVNQGSIMFAYRSNTVRVLKQQIAAVLRHVSPAATMPFSRGF